MSLHPTRRFSLVVNGQDYCIELSDLSVSPVEVSVNGNLYQVTIEPTESQPVLAQPVVTAAPTPVVPAVMPAVGPPIAVAGSDRQVRSPMPGDIIGISVKPGDSVVVGQQLCSLEAMKMKSAIRSARDGVIASVEVTEGQAVSHGDVLINFE